jgi:hypothetical protein
MAIEDKSGMECPRDGASMEARGRRDRVWRCPECGGMFVDVKAWRASRAGGPPPWLPVVSSIALSVGMTLLVRWLRSLRASSPAS